MIKMLIDHDTCSKIIIVECEGCHRYWLFDESDIILEPWPHVECPKCGEWIPLY